MKAKIEVEAEPLKPVRAGAKAPQLLRGFKDILPADQGEWDYLRQTAAKLARDYGFGRIDLPILEQQQLFIRGIGKETDIVGKEMFTFTDQGEDEVALRPEATAGAARSYISHGMLNLPQPVKLWYWGQMFRREKPQSGRLRQFHQFGCEVFGDRHPVVDAQLIMLAYNFFRQVGLEQVSIQVNTIGTPEDRKNYRKELVSYFRSKRHLLNADARNRLAKNPLRLLDSKDPEFQPIRAEAPQIVDWISDESKAHFMKVIDFLDELDIPYTLNPYLVRGLDYYSHTVFEIWPEEQEGNAQSALGGGGRYDYLIETLGGRPAAACGFSLGIERVLSELRKRGVAIPVEEPPAVFLAQIGDQAKVKAMKLLEQLRLVGIHAAESFAKDSLKSQLDLANKLGVRIAVILGQKEVLDGTVLIREMDSGVQEVVNSDKIVVELQKKLANIPYTRPISVAEPLPDNQDENLGTE